MKNTLRIVRGGNLRNHLFLWKKEWVRPYESPISAYMNFVMLNAISAGDVKRYWGIPKEYSAQYYREAVISDIRGGMKFVEKLYEYLLPYEANDFPELAGDFNYKKNFCYCPECIKQGYHSYICQLPFETICPIHEIPYINIDKPLPIGMPKYTDYTNVLGTFPLPPEREELDYTKITEKLQQYKSNVKMYVSSSDNINDKSNLDNRIKTHIFTVTDDYDYSEFSKETLMYLAKVASTVLMMWSGNEIGTITPQSVYEDYKCFSGSWQFPKVMEMACLYDYVIGLDPQKYPGCYPMLNRIYIDPEKMPVTKENIRGSYCYAVRGCRDIYGTFDYKYLFYNYSWVNERRSIDTTLLGVLEDKISHIPTHKTFYNKEDIPFFALNNIISCIIIKDQFWFLAKRFEDSVQGMEYFDFYNHWKCLRPLLYEIDLYDDKVEIYRIEI